MKFNSTFKQVNKLNIVEDRNEPIVGPVLQPLQPIATNDIVNNNVGGRCRTVAFLVTWNAASFGQSSIRFCGISCLPCMVAALRLSSHGIPMDSILQ